MSDLVRKAFRLLYPDVEDTRYTFHLRYSRAFSPYNANVRYMRNGKEYRFRMSHLWRDVDADIQIGMVQHLMMKAFPFDAEEENNIDLYEAFLRNVHKAVPKTESDPALLASFTRVNEEYFTGNMDRPNLCWGKASRRRLGHYSYGSDTITVSAIFKRAPPEVLDYIMYHEMLHKKHKFRSSGTRSYHHTRAFRDDEKRFRGADERMLQGFLRKRFL